MAFALPVLLAAHEELLMNQDDPDAPSCFDEFDDESLFKLFHLTRPCIAFITDSIRARMENVAPRKPHLSVDTLVMVTLNYYAHGISSASLLNKLGLTHTHCPAIISLVSGTISGMAEQFVSFPQTEEAKATVASNIEAVCGIPKVMGVLASAHFRVRVSPYDKEDYKTFFSPLGYTAVVSQIICDADGNVLSIEESAVGSTSEQEMWESSAIGKEIEEDLYGPYWFIGKMKCILVVWPMGQNRPDRGYNPENLENKKIT